ncbi:3-oxoacyl-ACP synthase III family protein [Streptomyces sp. NPDC003006]
MAAHLPGRRMTIAEVEEEVVRHSPAFEVPRGMIGRLTGVENRYVRPSDWEASDLAVAAADKALDRAGRTIGEIDLLIFAAMSAEVLEPATAHIVADKLRASCPVFDVKNACNSFLNAMQVADALIRSGAHRRVLVCCGETPTQFQQTSVATAQEFVESIVGYTLSDAGAAVVLEGAAGPGIIGSRFLAASSAWKEGVLPFPGAPSPRQRSRFRVGRMTEAVRSLRSDPTHILNGLVGSEREVALLCLHVAAFRSAEDFRRDVGVPEDRLSVTISSHGNTAAATLPLQLATALEQGRVRPGDIVLLTGFASGVSVGVLALRL